MLVRKGLMGLGSGVPKPDGARVGVPAIEANGLVGLSGALTVPCWPESCCCCNCWGVVGRARTGLAKGLVYVVVVVIVGFIAVPVCEVRNGDCGFGK